MDNDLPRLPRDEVMLHRMERIKRIAEKLMSLRPGDPAHPKAVETIYTLAAYTKYLLNERIENKNAKKNASEIVDAFVKIEFDNEAESVAWLKQNIAAALDDAERAGKHGEHSVEKTIKDSPAARRAAKSTRITRPMSDFMHYYSSETLGRIAAGGKPIEEESGGGKD